MLSVREAADRLGVSYSALKQWIYKGTVRTVRTGGGHHRVPLAEVDRLLSQQTAPSSRALPRPAASTHGVLVALSGRNQLRGIVDEVRHDGLLAQVRLRIGDQRLTAVITARRGGRTQADAWRRGAGHHQVHRGDDRTRAATGGAAAPPAGRPRRCSFAVEFGPAPSPPLRFRRVKEVLMRRRVLSVLVLALLPVALSGQAPADRLTLDLYWEYETVVDPQPSPDGAQVIYTRQAFDKVNDRRDQALWIMNADGSRPRFLAKGSNARWSPTGDRIAYTATGEPKGTQIFVRYMDAEGATSQVTHVEQAPGTLAWSPDGTSIAFTMNVVQKNTWPIAMPKRARRRQVDRGAAHRRTARLPAGPRGLRRRRLSPPVRRPRLGRHAASAHHRRLESHRRRMDARRPAAALHRQPSARCRARLARERHLRGGAWTRGAITQLTQRRGPDTGPKISPDGKLVAYTGYDFTKDTWIDSKLYVMNADGSNPRLVSGAWDRSPQDVTWKADSSAIYFTAQDQGAQNLYVLPLTGDRRGHGAAADHRRPPAHGLGHHGEGPGLRRVDLGPRAARRRDARRGRAEARSRASRR